MRDRTLLAAIISAAVGFAGGSVSVNETTLLDEAVLQEDYFSRFGEYDQKLPTKNIRVDVYESPKGKGYQIIEETSQGTVSIGFGPEAAERTYAHVNVSTTTP